MLGALDCGVYLLVRLCGLQYLTELWTEILPVTRQCHMILIKGSSCSSAMLQNVIVELR
jgi:hypothetical protein